MADTQPQASDIPERTRSRTLTQCDWRRRRLGSINFIGCANWGFRSDAWRTAVAWAAPGTGTVIRAAADSERRPTAIRFQKSCFRSGLEGTLPGQPARMSAT